MLARDTSCGLRVFSAISELVPEMRLGQLMANLSYLARGPVVESIWDMEDEELLAAAKKASGRVEGSSGGDGHLTSDL